MKISTGMLRIIQVLLTLVIGAVVTLAGWFLLSLNTDTTEAQIKAHLTRMEASAQIYYAKLQFYDGVCQDIGVPAGYSCSSSSEAYAIETALGGGQYWCLDSQGFFSKTVISKGSGTSCRRY